MKTVELQLQINGVYKVVDIDEKASFSITHKQSDLTNPTVVKIPFSVQIGLPKTKTNSQVFSCIGIRSTNDILNPHVPVNFRLFVNNNIYQIGYITIEEVDVEENGYFRIRLYGGLGYFFNYLSNIPLSYLPIECTHTLNAKTLKDLVENDNGLYGYALTYQGEYEKFESNKTENKTGIEESTWTGKTGGPKGNVELDENKRNETDYSGEYRAYYQKPTLKFRPILDKIIEKAKEDKYEVELDEIFFTDTNPYYNDLWLLCKGYEVGDFPGGLNFSVNEFGDNGPYLFPNSALKIENNDAKDLNNTPIEAAKFRSKSGSDPINCEVVISDPLKLKTGDVINVSFATKMIATYHENGNDPERYRHKNSDITCSLLLYDANTKILIGSLPTPKNIGASSPVQSRLFNDNNVHIKRPTYHKPEYFGTQNFAYDVNPSETENSAYSYDSETKWKYSLSYKSDSDIEVIVVFKVEGNTWWKANQNPTKDYGVAFKVLEDSAIVINSELGGENGRLKSQKTFADMIGEEYNCFDLLLSYCKIFGLIFKVDNSTNKIKILLRDNYYSKDNIIDWTNKVDRKKSFSFEPVSFKFKRGVFKYNSLDSKYEQEYREATKLKEKNKKTDGKEYGSFTVGTGYDFNEDEFNYLDGIIFDNCVIASDYSQYYAGRNNIALRDNKELPHLQSKDGSGIDIKGFIPVFRDTAKTLNRKYRITNDTSLMASQGIVCWNNSNDNFEETDKQPSYLRTIKKNDEYFSLNFGVPSVTYSDSENKQDNKTGIYPRYWRSYITDRLDPNCKILTCNVFLTPSDINNDILSKFVYLDQSLWVIDEISNFNPISKGATKVKLIKIKDIDNYLNHNNKSSSFTVSYNGESIYDSLSGLLPSILIVDDSITSIVLDISSETTWNATSNIKIDPISGNVGDTSVNLEIPTEQKNAFVKFVYEGNPVTIKIERKVLFDVTATTINGTSASINGLSSPQKIESGSTVTLNATGSNNFLYWEINGEKNTTKVLTLTVTENINAVAYFTGSNQVLLYCTDKNTTVGGVDKTGDYWVLNVGQSYTFSNTDSNFSGFLFSGDKEYTKTGAKTIESKHNSLSVYYSKVLLNLTVINKSPTHNFSGDKIYIGTKNFDFDVPVNTTEKSTQDCEPGNVFSFDRLDYHYPTFSQKTFSNVGVYDVTITGNRVGWEGDLEENVIQNGGLTMNKNVYSPIPFTLSSDLEVSPKSGNTDASITIKLTGQGGQVVQKVGDFEYKLTLIQKEIKKIGWNGDGTIVIETKVLATATIVTGVFYHNGVPVVLSPGLNKGADTTDADGSIKSTMTATFTANSGPERLLIFTVQCNGTAYMLKVTQQAGGSISGEYWGQKPDANGVVQGLLKHANGLLPSYGNSFDIGDIYRHYNNVFFNNWFTDNVAKIESYSKNSSGIFNLYPAMYVGATSNETAWNTLINGNFTFYSERIGCGSFLETSDRNKKDIIEKIDSVDLSTIKVYRFTYKDDEKKRVKIGVIAQEVETVANDIVYGEEGEKSVNYNALVALLINKVNELEARIKDLENK